MRAYNAHPPGRGSWNLWNFFMDHVNRRFQWADPLSPERRKLVRMSDKLLKKASEAKRNGELFDTSVPERAVRLITDLVMAGDIRNRKTLLAKAKPG